MIQILGIRSFINEQGQSKKYDAFYKEMWRAESIFDLYTNIETHIQKIPDKDRWNIFYTVANCGEGKREFKSQDVLAFDLDGINKDLIDEYIPVILATLGVEYNSTGIIHSGNGLHFIVALKSQIKDRNFFKENRHHYKQVCNKINKAIAEKGLCGKADSSVFDARRILRLPGTINRKPDKPEVTARFLQGALAKVDFNLAKLSGLPNVGAKEQIPKEYMRRYPRVDSEAVLEGCSFLKWCKDHGPEVNEPQWYAMLSIVGRLKDGDKLAHEYSEEHPGYSHEETEEKLTQALDSSGPRTCENIQNIWGQCQGCTHFEAVKSPIMLHGDGHIATEFTGFHYVDIGTNGKAKFTPCYEDLRKFFERQFIYKGLGDSRQVYVWKNTHYEKMGNTYLEEFAQTHFDPPANNLKVREFRELICRTSLTPVEWFEETTHRKMNFLNGTLDLETWEFNNHAPEVGFRHVLPYNYDPQAKAPQFKRMLERITDGDEDKQKVLLEYIGYSLSNDTCWAQKALVLVGEGANGKSTMMDIVKALVGEGHYASLTLDDMARSEYNRQMLDGKYFNFSEETPTKALLDNGLFKTLVTGGEVQVRSPYKDPYTIRNNAKLIFSCNELPKALDNTYGFYRRLIIVPFDKKFTRDDKEFDPHIKEKLMGELTGIFNYAISAYRRLRKNSAFTECKAVEKTVNTYISDNDFMRTWLQENTQILPLEEKEACAVDISDIYEGYKNDAIFSGERPITKIKFIKSMKKLIPDFDKRYYVRREKVNEMWKSFRAVKGVKCETGIGLEKADNVIWLK